MSTLKELRGRIKSIRSTQKITAAMQMVAAAKLRRTQDKVVSFRRYYQGMNDLVSRLLAQDIVTDDWPLEDIHLLKGTTGPVLFLFVSTNRGLCGSYNTNLMAAVKRAVENHSRVRFAVIGRKGFDLLPTVWKEKVLPLPAIEDFTYTTACRLAQQLRTWMQQGEIGSIQAVHYVFKNVMSQTLQLTPLVPVTPLSGQQTPSYCLLEPGIDELLPYVLKNYLDVQLYRIFLESSACEQAARMTAMDHATRNARDILQQLQLTYNQRRQAHITNQLIEIISAAQEI